MFKGVILRAALDHKAALKRPDTQPSQDGVVDDTRGRVCGLNEGRRIQGMTEVLGDDRSAKG